MPYNDPIWIQAASERLYRTTSALNTTQGEAAVWCSDILYNMPLEERRQDERLTTMSPVSYRLTDSCHIHHTAPTACIVLCATRVASRISDTIALERLYRSTCALNTTQGEAVVWCSDMQCNMPLEERRLSQSIFEEIFFTNSNAILNKKCPIFLSKTDSLMMLLLPCYVSSYHSTVTHTISKTCVLLRPTIKKREIGIRFHPFAGRHFKVLYEFGHGQCGWKRNKNMHMIWHSTNTVQMSTYVIYKAQDIRVEVSLMNGTNSILTAVCAEHNMIECLCITHTIVTLIGKRYCVSYAVSPVSDRLTDSCHIHHTASTTCVVLSATRVASRVSDTTTRTNNINFQYNKS